MEIFHFPTQQEIREKQFEHKIAQAFIDLHDPALDDTYTCIRRKLLEKASWELHKKYNIMPESIVYASPEGLRQLLMIYRHGIRHILDTL